MTVKERECTPAALRIVCARDFFGSPGLLYARARDFWEPRPLVCACQSTLSARVYTLRERESEIERARARERERERERERVGSLEMLRPSQTQKDTYQILHGHIPTACMYPPPRITCMHVSSPHHVTCMPYFLCPVPNPLPQPPPQPPPSISPETSATQYSFFKALK
jgi:hypothetical protein